MPNPESYPEVHGFSGAEKLKAALAAETVDMSEQAETELLERDVRTTLAERHPDWPPVMLEFLFGPHRSAANFAKLPEKLQGVHIYMYEDSEPAGSELRRKIRQSVTDPNYPESHLDKLLEINPQISGKVDEAILRALYRSDKIVSSMDLQDEPGEQELSDKISDIFDQPLTLGEDFDSALAGLANRYSSLAKLQLQREAIMTQRFETKLEEIIKEHPRLKEQDHINVLATMGVVHTTLSDSLSQAGVTTKQDFSQTPYVYPFVSELQREYMLGREPSRDLLARALMEFLVTSQLPEPSGDDSSDNTLISTIRQEIGEYGARDIEDFYNNEIVPNAHPAKAPEAQSGTDDLA